MSWPLHERRALVRMLQKGSNSLSMAAHAAMQVGMNRSIHEAAVTMSSFSTLVASLELSVSDLERVMVYTAAGTGPGFGPEGAGALAAVQRAAVALCAVEPAAMIEHYWNLCLAESSL